MIASVVTVAATTTPTVIAHGDIGVANNPRKVIIRNDGATTLYLGGSTLVAANAATVGFSVAQGVAVSLDLIGEDVYATTASSTTTASVLGSGSNQ